MRTTPIASWQACSNYPVPKNLLPNNLHIRLPTKLAVASRTVKPQCTKHSLLTLSPAQSCSKEQEKRQNQPHRAEDIREFSLDFCPSSENQSGQGEKLSTGITSSLWWSNLKAAVGQRINLEGITCSFGILSKDKHLVIPHVSVPDIRHVDWSAPYSLRLWAPLGPSVQQCKSLFGNNVAVFSNSAGLYEYDPDGRKAGALEEAIGINVIRHRVKKPAGKAEEIEKHFGCKSSRLIMVGDRPFTDIVYGNRNGFFTILTEPLSLEGEPLIVRQVRRLEVSIVRQWSKKGLKPISHELLSDPMTSVKDVPSS